MTKTLAFLACFLATLVLGSPDLWQHSTGSCAAADSCCCSEPATVDPCICGEHPASDLPEMAAFTGLPNLGAPNADDILTGEIEALADLLPRWHPAPPWHAPPEKMRARLAVWIL
ncbi:MAG: hypothetical protein WEB53_12190 [Akkermansiaceae bacterium]